MNPDMMALLKSILSGQGMSGTQRPAAPMQTPMQPQMQRPQMPMTAQQPMQMPATSLLPMAASEQHDGRPDLGVTPGIDQGLNDGRGDNGGDGKGGGDHGRGANLSKFEELMRKIANKGPRAYTKPIEKNIGVNKITPGYGKADPSTGRTGMADSLASVLNGTPDPNKMY
jgi:hypothetical protein